MFLNDHRLTVTWFIILYSASFSTFVAVPMSNFLICLFVKHSIFVISVISFVIEMCWIRLFCFVRENKSLTHTLCLTKSISLYILSWRLTLWLLILTLFCVFIKLFFMSKSICKSIDQCNTQETGAGLDNLFCCVPEVGGWYWAGPWQVAGVSPPSDLNSICPHAKGMNASEGEWHLALENHTHAQKTYTYTPKSFRTGWSCLLLPDRSSL